MSHHPTHRALNTLFLCCAGTRSHSFVQAEQALSELSHIPGLEMAISKDSFLSHFNREE